MNLTVHSMRRLLLAALGTASLLAGCGGGDGIGSGGTGAAAETFAVGTVDGFGSIFIGGERCDHIGALIGWDTVSGGPETLANPNPDLKLGQRVEVDLDGSAAACRILAARIAPEVIGVVGSTAPLTVAGAQILVNTDPALGPVTVFDGYGSAADITVGDRVEVHGKAVAAGGGVAIQATRIERKPASDAWVRVAGVISQLDATTFRLGGLTVHYGAGTTIVPAGFALRDGLTIAMWSTGAVAGSGDVDARFIRVLRRQFADQQRVRVQGPISGCNGASPCREPVLDGITVQITADTVFSVGTPADVVDGKTMHVRGSFDAASGKLVARAVAVRRLSDGVVTLIGSVTDFADDGTSKTFRVRGVPVATNANTQYGSNCGANPIGEGSLVAVAGQIAGSVVVAEGIACPQLAVGTVVDAYGAISQLDVNAKSFHISNRPLLSLATLQWDDHTVFSNGATPANLADGQYVAVRAVYLGLGKGFQLLRVVLDDTPPTSPTGGLVFSALGIAHHVSPTSMWVNLVPMTIVPGVSNVTPGVVNGALVRAWFYRDVPNARWVVLLAHPVNW